jgi:hypothetical protein
MAAIDPQFPPEVKQKLDNAEDPLTVFSLTEVLWFHQSHGFLFASIFFYAIKTITVEGALDRDFDLLNEAVDEA